MMTKIKSYVFIISMLLSLSAVSGDVDILNAEFAKHNDQWSVSVTLKHGDTGWEHYADKWRIVDEKGEVLGVRVLYHPHVNEQPFTRGLSLRIPKQTTIVYIEAHDKVHGWAKKRLKIDLTKITN